jgi:hypothetical protein
MKNNLLHLIVQLHMKDTDLFLQNTTYSIMMNITHSKSQPHYVFVISSNRKDNKVLALTNMVNQQ